MTKYEQLFYKLEPEGCWEHKTVEMKSVGKDKTYKYCKVCERSEPNFTKNPNLSNPTWEDFGWMMERCKKLRLYVSVILNDRSARVYECYVANSPLASRFYSIEEKAPLALRNALLEYYGIGESDE